MSIQSSVACVIVAAGCLCSSGCKTVYDITSEPSGAMVTVNGAAQGVTPVRVAYSNAKGRSVSCLVVKDGYEGAERLLGPAGGVAHFILESTEKPPISFVRTMEATWAAIQLREGVEYADAWNSVLDVLVRRFDMEVLSKENGYLRTGWLYTWTGEMREDYRVRVTAKFNPERDKVDVKSEANYRSKAGWVLGSDTALLRTLKTDLMGTVGRTTR